MKGSIEKRGENSYRLIISSGTGAQRKKYTRTVIVEGKTEAAKRKAAEIELAKFISEFEGACFIEPTKITFFAFCQKWFSEYAERNLAPKTVFRYKEMMNSRILDAIGSTKLSKVSPLQITEFLNSLKCDGARLDGKPGGLSPRTIEHHYSLLHAVFQTAVEWKMLKENPVDGVKKPKVPKHEAEFYDDEEMAMLLDALPKAKLIYQVAVLLTLAGGLREGELMGLKWENVDFKRNLINIEQSSQYLPRKGIFTKDPKNETSQRVLYMPPSIMGLLKKLKLQQEKQALKLGEKYNNTGYVFVCWNGEMMYTYTVGAWFTKFLKKNGLRYLNFHGLRHTAATYLICSGMDIKSVSKQLGHAKTSTTLDIYGHVLKKSSVEAAEKFQHGVLDASSYK